MGSGKSTVGPLVASALQWDFVDVDRVVEQREGRPVAEIFARSGESRFRELEAEATRDAVATPGRVVAPGGGWAATGGRVEGLGGSVLTVWLRVDAETAVERARSQPGVRPLLEVDDPVAEAERLLREREPRYRAASLHLDTQHTSPERLAQAIVQHLRSGGAAT